MILYRPVGPEELRLIAEADWKKFPPRLEWQPFFYPVIEPGYAKEINRWNVKAFGEGHIVVFEVDDGYISQHSFHYAGGRDRREYWIPAEDLDAFNAAIIGTIELMLTEKDDVS